MYEKITLYVGYHSEPLKVCVKHHEVFVRMNAFLWFVNGIKILTLNNFKD